MAITPTPEASRGVWGAIQGALGLFGDTNKAQGVDQNATFTPIEEYESSMSDEEIVELVQQWRKGYQAYYSEIDKSQTLAFDYWIGKHRGVENSTLMGNAGSSSVTDNLMFEAIETFLPIATRANPDPLVSADPSPEGQAIAKDLKVALVNEADTQKLRRKLAKMTRHWIIYRIGVVKISWDTLTKSIKTEVINPRRMLFSEDGYIDEGGHLVGEFVGEKKKEQAKQLCEMFPKKKEIIMAKAGGKDGTKLEYYEWWYKGTDVFYTLDQIVLGKFKNPHWNYDGTETVTDAETGEESEVEVQGTNHFKQPASPYVFLAMFNTGLHPHDDTSLIVQNISIQDLINRRYRQLDTNIDGMNNGMVVSGQAFTEEQAAQAAAALRRGVAIRVPQGDVRAAVERLPAPALPSQVAENLQDARGELRNIFGTAGSTPQASQKEETVRGKVLVAQQDTSRIGGGITEQIEQVADSIYNWWVQMMFVYFDEEHWFTTAGEQGGAELVGLINAQFPGLKTLNVTVKEGSLIPKDPLAKRNEAIDLWSANAIDPLNFYKALDFPDPNNAAKQLMLWQMFQKGLVPPDAYLPGFSQGQAAGVPLPATQPGTGGPAVNPVEGGGEQVPPPEAVSPEAVQQQEQQLLAAAPVQ